MLEQVLDPRAEQILRAIVHEHVSSAQPVGSETIARRYPVNASPATVRNVMAELEAAGYLYHPHTSAGRIPSALGYRYYIEHLMKEPRLPVEEQKRILHQFHQVELELAEWMRLSAALLSHAIGAAALVTLPSVPDSHLKHFHLLSVTELRAWIVAILQQGTLSQHMVTLDEPALQEELNSVAAKLNPLFSGLTGAEIGNRARQLAGNERVVAETLARGLQADLTRADNFTLEGLSDLLAQPEFADTDRRRRVLDVLGGRGRLLSLLPRWVGNDDVRVTIGDEHSRDDLRDLTVVLSPYGIPGEIEGIIALLGPTRLAYARAISHTRYLAGVMSELMRELYQ